MEKAGEQEVRGRTEKVYGQEGTRGKVGGGFEWASRGSKPGSGGGRSSANQRQQAAVEAAVEGGSAEGLVNGLKIKNNSTCRLSPQELGNHCHCCSADKIHIAIMFGWGLVWNCGGSWLNGGGLVWDCDWWGHWHRRGRK